MKRIFIYGFLIFVFSIGIGYYYSSLWKEKNNTSIIYDNIVKDEIATDTVSSDEKLSYNASFSLKKNYKECGHFDFKYAELPKELINLNKEQVESMYSNWNVEEFSSHYLVLSQDLDGYCDEHYLLKLGEDNIEIYKQLDKEKTKFYRSTNISIDYLTNSDIRKLKEGIVVYGIKNLNSAIEDFE